jgi:hypothetical protein
LEIKTFNSDFLQFFFHPHNQHNIIATSQVNISKKKKKKSFILKHQNKEHQGSPGSYTAKVTATAKDCLTRQVREAVHLRRCGVPTLNGKTEWHQPALIRIQSEILRG